MSRAAAARRQSEAGGGERSSRSALSPCVSACIGWQAYTAAQPLGLAANR
jgi:hypothetical protein